MATANNLYDMTPENESYDLSVFNGCYYNHLSEFNPNGEYLGNIKQDRVKIKTIKYFDFDGRRFWLLATIFFDSTPVMVIQNAGREGDDHAQRYITNKEYFLSLGAYVRSLMAVESEHIETIDANDEIPELTDFYGNSLDGVFQRY